MPSILDKAARIFRRWENDVAELNHDIDSERLEEISKAHGDELGIDTPRVIAKVNAGRAYNARKAEINEESFTTDEWNRGDRGLRSPGLQTGPQQSASGSGASRMVEDYSNQTAEQNQMVRALAELSDKLDRQNSRIEASEKALTALASFVTKVVKNDERFPESEREEGEEEDNREDEGDENERAEKAMRTGRLPTRSIPEYLDAFSRQSRHPGMPSFIKSGALARSLNEVMATEGDNLSTAESIELKTYARRLEAYHAGYLNAAAVGRLSEPCERIFAKSLEAVRLRRAA